METQWFHVAKVFIFLHEFVIFNLEVWIPFQPAFNCMNSSLCSEVGSPKLSEFHLYWKPNNESFIWLLSCVEKMLSTCLLLSWWIAPWAPLPRSSLNHAWDFCLLAAGIYVECQLEWWQLRIDQRVSSPELFLATLESCQGMFACLVKEFHKINHHQIIDQCYLVGQIAYLLTLCLEFSAYLYPAWWMVLYP